MYEPSTLLQSGGDPFVPLVLLVAAVVAVGGGAYLFVRDGGRSASIPASPDDEVVCPRCQHRTDATSNYCTECGADL